MTRTTRRDYRDRPIRDGQHGRRCPSPNCDTCAASRTRDKGPSTARDVDLTAPTEPREDHR